MTAPEMGRAPAGETGAQGKPTEGAASASRVPRRQAVPLDPARCAALVASPRWVDKVTHGPDGCLLWTGAPSANGYGRVRIDGRQAYAHRVALVASMGRDLAPGMEAGHLCHDAAHAAGLCVATSAEPCEHRLCVNPAHLAEQDQRTNTLAGGSWAAALAQRTHCPAGHALTGANLRPGQLAHGWRGCATCQRARAREQHRAITAAARALGMTQRTYESQYGRSVHTARAALAALDVPRLDQPAPEAAQLALDLEAAS